MKAINLKYLVFDANGDLSENNEIAFNNDLKIEFDLNLRVVVKGMELDLITGQLFVGNLRARLLTKNFAGRDLSLYSVTIGRDHYAAIVYHDKLNSLGFNLFYEWYPFFLPPREPTCCCKRNFNEVLLPYANKVMKSMVKYFEMEEYYGKSVLTKDLKILG